MQHFHLMLCCVMLCCVSLQAQQSGDVGRVMMVLITDGRANVSLAKSNEDPEAMAPDAPKPSQDDLKVWGFDGGFELANPARWQATTPKQG
jgi:hypothetical protein